MKTLLTLSVFVSTIAFFTPAASGAVFSDDFESGLAAWTMNPATPGLTISTDQNHTPGGTQSAATSTSSSRMYRNTGSEIADSARLTYYLYDSTGSRTYAELRSYTGAGWADGSLAQLIAIGKYHVGFGTPTGVFAGETVNTGLYQGRVVTGSSVGWFNLPGVARTPDAWVKFDLERLANGTLNFYVNDVLSRTVTDATFATIDSVMLGSVAAGTTATLGYYDDVSLTIIPEPTTYGIAFGLLSLAGIAYRRRARA